MSPQLAIPFDVRYELDRRWGGLLERVRRIVDRATSKEVSWLCRTTDGTLLNALHERERHTPRLRWLLAVLEAADDEERIALLGALGRPYGLEVVKHEELPPEERLRRLESAVAKCGPLARVIFDDAYGR